MPKILQNLTLLLILTLCLTGCSAADPTPPPIISTPAEPDTASPSTRPTSTPTQLPDLIIATQPAASHSMLPAGALRIVALGEGLTQGDGTRGERGA